MFDPLFVVLQTIVSLLFSVWWLWLPIFLFVIFFAVWMNYIRRRYWQSINWVLLEVKPPKDIEQSPKIVEAIFAGLWAIQGTIGTKVEKYIGGVIQHYFSFEIIGRGGETRFLIRSPDIYKNLVEAKIYASYPKAEIRVVDDYVDGIPSGVLGRDWDLWGTVLQLARPNPYPIRTYQEFVDVSSKQPFLDPIANLMEALAKLQPGEQVWIQILVRPADNDWTNEGRAVVAKLIGKNVSKKSGLLSQEISGWFEAIGAAFSELASGKAVEIKPVREETGPPSLVQFLSPGEKEVVAMIEKKMDKKALETKIQIIYLAKKEVFFKPHVAALMGFFNQFAMANCNSLKPNAWYTTKANYLWAEKRAAYKKRIMLNLCRQRPFWEKGYIFNIEELATIWHFPTVLVEAPMAPVVEAKKGGPPTGLPVV